MVNLLSLSVLCLIVLLMKINIAVLNFVCAYHISYIETFQTQNVFIISQVNVKISNIYCGCLSGLCTSQ